MARLAQLIALALAVAGCATAPTSRDFERTMPVAGASIDETWRAVSDVFDARGWPIDVVDREEGVVGTDWIRAGDRSGEVMDCGSHPLAIDIRHEFRVTATVAGARPGATMTLDVRARTYRSALREDFVDCASVGVLEEEIHEAVTDRARALRLTPK